MTPMLHYDMLGISYKMVTIPLFLCVMALSLMGCGSSSRQEKEEEATGKIKTKIIEFACAEQINQGMLLPVDVVYVTRYHRPREIIAIGPDRWFESFEREKWEAKQTLSLRGGETKKIELNNLWMEDTKLLIIFANFINVENPGSQQIVIDQSGSKEVKILVMPQSIRIEEKKRFRLFGF